MREDSAHATTGARPTCGKLSSVLLHWLRFNAVGALGVGVQLAALAFFRSVLGFHYLVATGLAVEAAVLHNFLWHEHWTWRDRSNPPSARLLRLARFNFSNGAISILGNLLLMRLLAGALGLHYFVANLLTIAILSLLNFLAADRFVFR